MTIVHLVRHGESEWNLAARVQGQSPHAGPLTETGRAQALATARALALQHPGADAIFSSDLGRARETASIIAGVLGLPVEEDPALREHLLGEFEGLRFADPLDGGGTVADAIDGLWANPGRPAPGGESITDLYVRVHEALRSYVAAYPDRELVLVTHGGVVRVATAPEDPRLGTPLPRRPVGNATVATLEFEPDSNTGAR